MSSFKALNIESDSESDVSVDDTKEIQIEDALKLYQTALHEHANAAESGDVSAFESANHAYAELFASDIFTWPESQTEWDRIELLGTVADEDDVLGDDFSSLPLKQLGTGGEAGPSTLPQILHLAHKNYAHFKLEALSAKITTSDISLQQLLIDASTAFEHFVQALDKDDGDLDLWKRSATVGEFLDSRRIARFCLEAVLDGDEDTLANVLGVPGLQDTIAREKLHELLAVMRDSLSLLLISPTTAKRKIFPETLQRRLDPYQIIRQRGRIVNVQTSNGDRMLRPLRRTLLRTPATWAQLGEMLLIRRNAQQHGANSELAGVALGIELNEQHHVHSHDLEQKANHATTSQPLVFRHMPTDISKVFPGLDGGKPTVQPTIAAADSSMAIVIGCNYKFDPANRSFGTTKELPTRKRSGDTAGLADDEEEGRTKSKRIRARDSIADQSDSRQAFIDANKQWEYEQQLNEFQAVDDWMYDTVGALFERVGIIDFNQVKNVRQELDDSTWGSDVTIDLESRDGAFKQARRDLKKFLDNYNDQFASLLLVGGDQLDAAKGSAFPGSTVSFRDTSAGKNLPRPPLMPNEKLNAFLHVINNSWFQTEDVACEWIASLLRGDSYTDEKDSYVQFQWPEDLKTIVVRLLVTFDEDITKRTRFELEDLLSQGHTAKYESFCAMIQAIFELHLDVYSLIKEPNSGVDSRTTAVQGDRLTRWAELAREAMRAQTLRKTSPALTDELSLRFMWATTFYIAASNDVSQHHTIECMKDLRRIWLEAGEPMIHLQNNAIMPELSIASLDRELSRLTTRDFFLKVTSQDLEDPVLVIESLAPLLEAVDENGTESNDSVSEKADSPIGLGISAELVQFVRDSSMSARLLLWQRLRDAFAAIDFKSMMISCYFRMTRMLLRELVLACSAASGENERLTVVLNTLRVLLEYMTQILQLVQGAANPMEMLDDDSFRSAVQSIREILSLLQVFNVYEDSIRVGQCQAPVQSSSSATASYSAMTAVIRDSQLHIWMVLYSILKETIRQAADVYPAPLEDRFDFLRSVHRNLGIRGICGGSNRAFVRMLKDEFFTMTHVDGYDSEQAQVLYDLYGLNCFLNPSYELIEHHCTRDAFLDRGVALQAVDLLLSQANKLPMKDLIKHPLRDTIEKVHGAAPRKKPTESIMRNKEICRARMRQPINPLDLYASLRGEASELPVTPISQSDAVLSSKGWHFLMGHMSLARFKSVKRTAQTSTEDLDIANAFFTQDQEHSMEKWETWFRIGQTYDAKIEESIKWSAEKINSSKDELAKLERNAINCYTMALALAYRSADLAFDTTDKMTELYIDFATRLYSSSREPLSMQAFALDELEIFLGTLIDDGLPKTKPFKPLGEYTCWKLAKVLYQRALPGRPRDWTLRFQLAKVLWKMHSAPPKVQKHNTPPSAQDVIACILKALELAPGKKDVRDTKREPVLEPHYKLVTIIHKMVSRGTIGLGEAREALTNTQYAASAPFPEEISGWNDYILRVMYNLRIADKSNWHHRMINRSAQIVYAASSANESGAQGAKAEYMKQMFTKTMVLQVWRPESERPGRHFVYTSRYTRFLTRILEQLKDRASLEQLARRVRRRPHDLFEHSLVWQDICNAWLRLLRSYAQLAEGLETSTFSNIAHEDFTARKELLELWMQKQDVGSSPTLDVLREVQELKKINQGLMKPGVIDDLIGDAYAHLFNTVGKQQYDEDRKIKQEGTMSHQSSTPPPAVSPFRNPAMSLSHLMNLDGVSGSSSRAPSPPLLPSAGPNAEAPPRRKAGVGRREIRAAAEACYQKAGTHKSMDKVELPPNVRVEVVINNSRMDLAGDFSAHSSVPGSVHDSADDESDLSDLSTEGSSDHDDNIDEERGQYRMGLTFPNLVTLDEGDEVSQEGDDVATGGSSERRADAAGDDAMEWDTPDEDATASFDDAAEQS